MAKIILEFTEVLAKSQLVEVPLSKLIKLSWVGG